MNLQTFRAPSMAECLADVKRTMGPEAVILHTRTLTLKRFLGLRRREIVEITAGRGLNGGPRGPKTRQPRGPLPEPAPVAVLPPPADGRDPISQAIAPPRPIGPDRELEDMRKKVNGLGDMMKTLLEEVRRKETPDVPADLFDEYTQLVENGVERQIAEEIVRTLHRSLRPDHFSQKQFVREKVVEQIERMLPTSGAIMRTKTTGPHVVALIGPTGVGKTTTIAKLAAKLKLDENRKVGLITIDTYRIAAIDQLKRYAEILGSPLKVVGSADDLRDAVAFMKDCHFVLIDTAGRSPNDLMKLNELKTFLEAASPDEVHMVVSSTSERGSMDFAIEKFGNVRIDKLIFTKLDETRCVGSILNVVRSVKKPISYVTAGQDVPADIEVAKGKQLARTILGEKQ